MPIAPPLTFNYVDVRDVAEAHGRYLGTDKTWTAAQALALLKDLRPEVKFYGKTTPLRLAKILPYAEVLQNRLFGTPLLITSAAVAEYFGREQAYKSDRLRREIGGTTRPRAHQLVRYATVDSAPGDLDQRLNPPFAIEFPLTS